MNGKHRLPNTHNSIILNRCGTYIMRLLGFALIGMKQVDIANHLSISPVTVSYVLNSPIVERQMNQLKAVRDLEAIDISKEIKELAPKAIQVLEDLMDNELPNIKLKAATDILDRAGYAAVKTLRTENLHAHFSSEEIADIRQRAREVGLLTDVIIPDHEQDVVNL